MGCCMSKKQLKQQKSNRNIIKRDGFPGSQKQAQILKEDQLTAIRSPLTSSPIVKHNSQDDDHQVYPEQHKQEEDQEKEFPSSKYELNPVTVSIENNNNRLTPPNSPGGTPYTPNGLDYSNQNGNDLDNQSVLSVNSSQARNLGPLIAARMKKKSNAMKKTIGVSKEIAIRNSGAHSSGGHHSSGHNSFKLCPIPETRAGYMMKQGKTFKTFKKYYYLLNNGLLMSFENEKDSLNNEKINERHDKVISMDGYKLISIQNKNHLILEEDEEIYHAIHNNNNNNSRTSSSSRLSSFSNSMSHRGGSASENGGERKRKHVFEIKDHTQYLLWQNAFQAHILYANLDAMNNSNNNSIRESNNT